MSQKLSPPTVDPISLVLSVNWVLPPDSKFSENKVVCEKTCVEIRHAKAGKIFFIG
jgi:hypothetical protein